MYFDWQGHEKLEERNVLKLAESQDVQPVAVPDMQVRQL
jgi:hypothetical protein